jgi:hypothetical protein
VNLKQVTIILQFINDQICFNDFFAYPRRSHKIHLLPAASLRIVPFIWEQVPQKGRYVNGIAGQYTRNISTGSVELQLTRQ